MQWNDSFYFHNCIFVIHMFSKYLIENIYIRLQAPGTVPAFYLQKQAEHLFGTQATCLVLLVYADDVPKVF